MNKNTSDDLITVRTATETWNAGLYNINRISPLLARFIRANVLDLTHEDPLPVALFLHRKELGPPASKIENVASFVEFIRRYRIVHPHRLPKIAESWLCAQRRWKTYVTRANPSAKRTFKCSKDLVRVLAEDDTNAWVELLALGSACRHNGIWKLATKAALVSEWLDGRRIEEATGGARAVLKLREADIGGVKKALHGFEV